MTDTQRPGRRAALFAGVVVYVLLLAASHVFQLLGSSAEHVQFGSDDPPRVELAALDADGSIITGKTTPVYYEHWVPPSNVDRREPVLLIHGSPGSGSNFVLLGPELARDGRRVIAPDLPGYGNSPMTPSMSHETNAKYMARMLDELGIGRVHVVGWSSGGGVAMELAHQFPDRVASVTLLAAIAAQETEGSGSYFFEHVKYGVGIATLGVVPELIPHFGVLGDWSGRTGWLWAFWDSDQRRISRFMGELETPVLILHGRHDPLISDWAAERHHKMIPTSKLVMLDASHFLPFMQVEETRDQLLAFFSRHDTPGVSPETGVVDLAPIPDRAGGDAFVRVVGMGIRELPWWVVLIGATLLVRARPQLGMVLVMLFAALLVVDFGVALGAMLVGRGWWLTRGTGVLDRPWTLPGWVRGLLFPIPAFVVGLVGGGWTLALADRFDWFGLILGIIIGKEIHWLDWLGLAIGVWLTWLALVTLRLVVTWEGRQRIKGWLRRRMNHEYWSTLVYYIPVLWWGLMRVVTGKGLRALTAVNPGYADNAGVRNESKHDINTRLGEEPGVLPCVLVPAGDRLAARIERARACVRDDESLGGYPVICKPDRGERGRGVRLARTPDDIERYCRDYREDFVIQRYHPGPAEVGLVWVRHERSISGDTPHAGSIGFIYAINTKGFPEIVGDGKLTIRKLILAHPRHRAQARVLLEHTCAIQHRVPQRGETVAIGVAGNHAQGAQFNDGAEVITDELTHAINSVAARLDAYGGFDIGRFDLRCESLEQLARGEGFGIVELNGLTSEPTNMYDPAKSLLWAWGVLLGYWRHVARLADARITHGSGQPISNTEFRTLLRDFVRVMK